MIFRLSHLGAARRALASAQRRSALSDGTQYSLTFARWHVGHHHHHTPEQENASPSADQIFRLGLGSDVALAVGKAVTGYVSGSTAIIADAAHSVSDIVLSGVALWSYKAAKAPKDKEHPYGHGKFESLGTLAISSMLLVTAGGIAWHAIDVLQDVIGNTSLHGQHNHGHGGHHHGIDLEHPVLALSMTVVAVSVKEGLYWITKRAGEKEGSGLMKANAWHHRSDAISSVVALIGVGGTILGVPFLDPLAGLLVSGMILKAGIETGYESIMELVDAAVEMSVLQPIKETILQIEGVKGCHRLRGRKAGTSLYLDVHIEVDPFLSVSAAHEIGETVRHQIHQAHKQVAEAFIHIDPSYSQCSVNADKKKLSNSTDLEEKNSNLVSSQQEAEAIVSDILSTRFSKKMSLDRVILHLLQGKLLLQVQVSMPPQLMVEDAMKIANEAEKEILEADPRINQVSIQLSLGNQITKFS
ncbi:metal tolerance protein 2 [Carex littledalei]|uniref:Metal tolerance protein 2 n=1 Tax=Carex littledalei TaxID=544730 RepID=A0A833VFT8_9POAL|nr:metal tolerance protein 2 [Carex littledalei]